MEPKRIVLTGAPGTGKTTVINSLKKKGCYCFDEISRELIRMFQAKGVINPFATHPSEFNEQLLEGRIDQFNEADKHNNHPIFYDRGIHDIVAYMEYANTPVPHKYKTACSHFRYDLLFVFPPWKEIYNTDNERFESFEQACKIHEALLKIYIKYQYHPIEVPIGSVESRIKFIAHIQQCL